MRKTKIALAIAASAMISTPVLATNGDTLIGLGAQARAMGGTGTAAFFGSENALTNPALLAKSQGTEFTIGGTAFMPNVKAETDVATFPNGAAKGTSDNDMNIIPEVAMSTRINENLTFGLGMFGSAGMGVDFREEGALFNGYSNLQLMKFAPSIAYNAGNFGLGFAPVVQYGALDINYDTDDDTSNGVTGNGMSTDLGYGFNLGAYFDISENLTVAAAYQSAISMEYDDQITVAAGNLGLTQFDDKLTQPAEIKIGIAYTMDNIMLTADARQIKWGDADGYEDFNWKDQNVFALGAKYTGKDFWLGAGYNFGSDPIDVLDEDATLGQGGYNNQAINLFNNHFFPGIVERHFTFGGGYMIGKNMMLEGAVTYAPQVKKTVNTGAITSAFAAQAGDPNAANYPADMTTHTIKHSQLGYTVSVKMNF